MSRQRFFRKFALIVVFLIWHLPAMAEDWSEVSMEPGVNLNDLYMLDDGLHGWAVGASGASGLLLPVLMRTTDDGATWSSTIFPYLYIPNAVCFVTPERGWIACSSGKIYHSEDGGLTWQIQTSGTTRTLSAISFVSENEGWVTGGWQDGNSYLVLHTTDGGEHWVNQSFGSTCYSSDDIEFTDPLNGWICGYDSQLIGHIHHTDDGGLNWTRQTIPYADGQVASITFADANHGWASTSSIYAVPAGAILHTINGGATWTIQDYTGLHYNSAIDAQDNQHVAISSSQVLSPQQQKLATTSNGGQIWNLQDVPMLSYSVAIQYQDGSIRLTGDESRVLRTDDLGATWNWESYAAWWQGIGWRDAQTGWLVSVDYGGTIGFALRTDDGGATWTHDPNVPGGAQVLFADDLHGWMPMSGNGASIWRTIDGGDSWTQHFIGGGWTDEVFFINASRGWACGSGGMIKRTDDGGQSWSSQSSGTGNYVEVIFFVDDNEGWAAGGYGGGNGFIRHTTNGGDTWDYQSPASGGHHQVGFFLDNQRGWLVDVGGYVHRTLDGGSTWQIIGNLPFDYFNDLVMGDDQIGWITVGNAANSGGNGLGYIYKTENGGVSWTQEWASPWPRGWVGDIAKHPGGQLWVCGAHSTVLRRGSLAGAGEFESFATGFTLYPAAPNPLKHRTELSYYLQEAGRVDLAVFDFRGRLMKTLVAENQSVGSHALIWNGDGGGGKRLPGGVYFVQLRTIAGSQSQRMVVLQ